MSAKMASGMSASAARPILYTFRRCPYAMRARIALLRANIPVTVREIILRDKPDEMLAASPKGSVPVMVLPGGEVIDESLDILAWASGRAVATSLMPYGDLPAELAALIAENDGPFKYHLDRYKYATRYEDVDETVHRQAGWDILARLNDWLATSLYLHGELPDIADEAIFPFVRQFRIADPDWFDAQPASDLQRWLHALMDRPLFKTAMTKFPLWKDTGEEPLLKSA